MSSDNFVLSGDYVILSAIQTHVIQCRGQPWYKRKGLKFFGWPKKKNVCRLINSSPERRKKIENNFHGFPVFGND